MKLKNLAVALTFISILSCDNKNKRFELLSSAQTGITFNNKIIENVKFNAINFFYIYNGAGVGVLDVNNDGLPDLFFAGNKVSSKLYLNKGNMQFEDITKSAGVATHTWATGVSVVDINADGLQDIYVCMADNWSDSKGKNKLFVNNGDNTFTEQAEAYGLADTGYSTQASFFDYDMDGDLDMYLLTSNIDLFSHNLIRPIRANSESKGTDRLYRNNGDNTFTNVSAEAGISIEGYGLGIGVLDVNNDGWPDIYCSNDFISNDLLWINNQDGTFTNGINEYISQTSHNGMGIDIADINNDALMDIIEMDMFPESNLHHKTMTPAMNYNNQTMRFSLGYMPQYTRNTLQFRNENSGFSEIGRMMNIQKTDWSWAPLLADMDNDGYKDLFITNGYGRDVTDLDYIVYTEQENNPFGTPEAKQQRAYDEFKKLNTINIPNYFFKYDETFSYRDVSKEWVDSKSSISHGAIYADLDLDGDLDLVSNNMNQEAFIYRNRSIELNPDNYNYLRVNLKGTNINPFAVGAKVTLFQNGKKQILENYPVRGYLSTVEHILHFGLGENSTVDSLVVKWPDNKTERYLNIKTNRTINIKYGSGKIIKEKLMAFPETLLQKKDSLVKDIKHKENDFVDFLDQPLLLRMMSREGPGLACADIDQDGLEDLIMGTAYGDTTYVYVQNAQGKYIKSTYLMDSWKHEDLGILIADFNNDQLSDIYIASGGNEFPKQDKAYQDRLYYQNTDGTFALSNKLPKISSSTATVNAVDFDKDGDLDLFVGSRLIPKEYPYPGKSYLLINENGHFIDKIDSVAPDLENLGLVTAALWTDYNNDGNIDLIVVGEWMTVNVFKNENGNLVNRTEEAELDKIPGFWNSINGADLDLDGDIDYVVGNNGINSELKATEKEPITIIAKDFDQNGSIDPIIGHYSQGINYPFATRDAISTQIVGMKKRFPSYLDYAKVEFDALFSSDEKKNAYKKQATYLQSAVLENLGNGKFKHHPLPKMAQMAPMYGSIITDLNDDNFPDIMLSGNRSDTETLSGFMDASLGVVLLSDGNMNFTALPSKESGFQLENLNSRSMVVTVANSELNYVIGNNNNSIRAFNRPIKNQVIKLEPNDISIIMKFKDGRILKKEIYYGEGYLSQSTRQLMVPKNTTSINITDSMGNVRNIEIPLNN